MIRHRMTQVGRCASRPFDFLHVIWRTPSIVKRMQRTEECPARNDVRRGQ
jgi:hypothetical protein